MKKIKFCSRNITELLKIRGKLWHTHWKLENRNEEKLWKKWNVSKTNYLAQQGSVFITSSNMMAIFCVNLTGLRDTQIVVKCYFSVSLSMFPGEINIWIRSLSKEGGPWQNGWTSSHLPEGLNRTEESGKGKYALCLNRDICPHLSSDSGTPDYLGFQTWTDLHNWLLCSQGSDSECTVLLAFLGLQLADKYISLFLLPWKTLIQICILLLHLNCDKNEG